MKGESAFFMVLNCAIYWFWVQVCLRSYRGLDVYFGSVAWTIVCCCVAWAINVTQITLLNHSTSKNHQRYSSSQEKSPPSLLLPLPLSFPLQDLTNWQVELPLVDDCHSSCNHHIYRPMNRQLLHYSIHSIA